MEGQVLRFPDHRDCGPHHRHANKAAPRPRNVVAPNDMNHANEVVYCGDTRYPGPASYPVPEGVEGVPTQAELDAHPRLFTWGELKEIIRECALVLCSPSPIGTR